MTEPNVAQPLPPWATPAGREPFAEVNLGPNRVALLKDGFQAYPTMLEAIRGARHTIALETYILRDDTTGRRFIDALMERARAGVEVLVMYDYWGSDLSDDCVAEMETAGVKVLVFKPLKWTGKLSGWFVRFRRRNHRKVLVVDGQVGFTGGLNISDDYAAVEDGGKGWRDTHVRIVGPAAGDLERHFLGTWLRFRGPRFDEHRFRRPARAPSAFLRIISNDFGSGRRTIRKTYVGAITKARRRILLTHAYFLPPARVVRALTRAAKRGVRVMVILAASTDVKAVLYAARALYRRLLKSGVEVYEWEGRVLHAKTAVIDGRWATVGSANLDPQSLRENLEINAVMEDPRFAQAVEHMFEKDLASCTEVTMATVRGYGWLERLLQALAYRVRRWL